MPLAALVGVIDKGCAAGFLIVMRTFSRRRPTHDVAAPFPSKGLQAH